MSDIDLMKQLVSELEVNLKGFMERFEGMYSQFKNNTLSLSENQKKEIETSFQLSHSVIVLLERILDTDPKEIYETYQNLLVLYQRFELFVRELAEKRYINKIIN